MDKALFTIDATTGALSFIAPRDFEAATDANGDNAYVVQVRVKDSQGGTATQTIQVTVTDVAERLPSSLSLPPSLIQISPAQGGMSIQPHDEPLSFRALQEPMNAAAPATWTDFGSGVTSRDTGIPPARAVPHLDDIRHGEEQPVAPRSVQQDDRETWKPHQSSPSDAIDAGRGIHSAAEPPVIELVLKKLDEVILSLREAVAVDRASQSLMTHITALTGTTLSLGFVLWAVRKGKLLAACCATIPTLSAEGATRL